MLGCCDAVLLAESSPLAPPPCSSHAVAKTAYVLHMWFCPVGPIFHGWAIAMPRMQEAGRLTVVCKRWAPRQDAAMMPAIFSNDLSEHPLLLPAVKQRHEAPARIIS